MIVTHLRSKGVALRSSERKSSMKKKKTRKKRRRSEYEVVALFRDRKITIEPFAVNMYPQKI